MPDDDDTTTAAGDLPSRSLRRPKSRAALDDEDEHRAESDDEDDTDGADSRRGTKRRKAPVWVETGVLLVVALAMALIIKTFFVQAFYIPSGSMEPGLQVNDRILVQKVSYWFGSPHRGDIVVFEDPGGWLTGPEKGPQTWLAEGLAKVGLYPTGGHLVKRVIGIPGDTVACCDKAGHLTINGVALDEDDFIRPQPQCDGPMVSACTKDWSVTIPDDRLFVMGDNRGASADSSDRYGSYCKIGQPVCEKALVPIDLVVGKVFALVWPLDHARFTNDPDVFDKVPH